MGARLARSRWRLPALPTTHGLSSLQLEPELCAVRTRQPPDFVQFAECLPKFGFLKRAQSSEPRVPAPRLFGAVELGEPPDFVTVAELFERAPEHEKAIEDSFSCGVCQAWQKLLRSREGVSLYTRDELPTDDCALFRCSC